MKRTFLYVLPILFLSRRGTGQSSNKRASNISIKNHTETYPIVRIEDISKYTGKNVSVIGHFYGYKRINDQQIQLTLLGDAPYYSILILIEGANIKLDSAKLKRLKIKVWGAVAIQNKVKVVNIHSLSQLSFFSQ